MAATLCWALVVVLAVVVVMVVQWGMVVELRRRVVWSLVWTCMVLQWC